MSRFATYVEKTIVFIAGSRIHKRAWKHVSNYLVLHGECHSCHVATKFVRLHNYTVLPLRCRRQDGFGMQFLSPSFDVWAKQDTEVLLYDWLSRIIRQMWTIREFSEKPRNFSMVVMFWLLSFIVLGFKTRCTPIEVYNHFQHIFTVSQIEQSSTIKIGQGISVDSYEYSIKSGWLAQW